MTGEFKRKRKRKSPRDRARREGASRSLQEGPDGNIWKTSEKKKNSEETLKEKTKRKENLAEKGGGKKALDEDKRELKVEIFRGE